MSKPSQTPAARNAPAAPNDGKPPSHLPPELADLHDWWQANGSRLLTVAAIVAITASAAFIYWRHVANRKAEAAVAAATARGIDDLEAVVARYGSTPAGISARLRLARAYCDAGRYDDALQTYEAFTDKHPSHPFAVVAALGRAQALEGLHRAAEALAIYRSFRSSNPDHYLAPSAWMGEARCLALLGQTKEAAALLDDLCLARTNTPWEVLARDLQGVIARFDGRMPATGSLFDRASLLMAPAATPGATGVTGEVPTPAATGATNAPLLP